MINNIESQGRTVVIVGGHRVYNIDDVLDYVRKFQRINRLIRDKIYMVLYLNFEKTNNWDGYIYSHPNGVQYALCEVRNLLSTLKFMNIPIAYQYDDMFIYENIKEYITIEYSKSNLIMETSDIDNHITSMLKFENGIIINCYQSSLEHINIQADIAENVGNYIQNNKDTDVIGMKLQSNLHEGSQQIGRYYQRGISVTEPCISWDTTESILRHLWCTLSL